MPIRAVNAAEKTTSLGCFIAIKAATRKVLSPISENMIIVKDKTNEWRGCNRDAVVADVSEGSASVYGLRMASGSFLLAVGGTGGGIS